MIQLRSLLGVVLFSIWVSGCGSENRPQRFHQHEKIFAGNCTQKYLGVAPSIDTCTDYHISEEFSGIADFVKNHMKTECTDAHDPTNNFSSVYVLGKKCEAKSVVGFCSYDVRFDEDGKKFTVKHVKVYQAGRTKQNAKTECRQTYQGVFSEKLKAYKK